MRRRRGRPGRGPRSATGQTAGSAPGRRGPHGARAGTRTLPRGRQRDRRWRSHSPRFAARSAAPTSQPPAAGARARPRSSTSCRARRRTARARAGAPRPSGRARPPPWRSPAFSMKFACFGEICAPPIAMALETARLEHPPRAQLVLRVLEDAPEGAPVRRLRRLAPCVQLAHLGLDLLGRPRAAAATRPGRRPARAGGSSGGTRGRARRASASPCPSAVATSARTSTCENSPP